MTISSACSSAVVGASPSRSFFQAACASGSLEPSHVLTAMALSREEVRGSLRFSLGAQTTREEVLYTVAALEEIVRRLREMLPGDERESTEMTLS